MVWGHRYLAAHPDAALAFDEHADVELVFAQLDMSGDGTVSLSEFRSAVLAQRHEAERATLTQYTHSPLVWSVLSSHHFHLCTASLRVCRS